jgi:hypothetical protein
MWTALGACYKENSRPDDAIKCLIRAVDHDEACVVAGGARERCMRVSRVPSQGWRCGAPAGADVP